MPIRSKVLSSFYGQLVAGVFVPSRGASSLGQITRVAGTVSGLSSDLQGSEYHLLDVPSSAIMLPTSAIRTTAWSFAQAVIGVDGDTDALLDVAKATGGATGNTPITIFGAIWNKPIWQQLGMAADPGNPITLKVFTEADATVDGQIDFDLQFANHV
ncbi:hypothetical protein [Roseobacter sp.]|uniref:hypothetical protein n=1 Tax=Roseobacter sp. TaxID=1907202 RepID=UPI002966D88E|nr:hypothetical protein [Roseobacter sp.]MDW3181772.1 hypothetical protein [Roseobacter sp.]